MKKPIDPFPLLVAVEFLGDNGFGTEAEVFRQWVEERTRPHVPDVLPLAVAYLSKPGNHIGGNLHIVLEDHNCGDDSIRHCIGRCVEAGDKDGETLARKLLAMSMTGRRKVVARSRPSADRTWTCQEPLSSLVPPFMVGDFMSGLGWSTQGIGTFGTPSYSGSMLERYVGIGDNVSVILPPSDDGLTILFPTDGSLPPGEYRFSAINPSGGPLRLSLRRKSPCGQWEPAEDIRVIGPDERGLVYLEVVT